MSIINSLYKSLIKELLGTEMTQNGATNVLGEQRSGLFFFAAGKILALSSSNIYPGLHQAAERRVLVPVETPTR